ncbi:hypothetical protein [Sporomusa sp.]|uniref:hypothetical protein n=1 Tax=Sporomusa sp. TaxID=2078658 RepID=UPI002C4959F0|nr:hypothetical protein [Sporomusa sp.]HWR06177.1 hypothetical protein [Sporomusa sp.]
MATVTRQVYGYCPYLDTDYSITVEYAVIYSLGKHEPGYKPIGADCDESEACPYDNGNKCPIYEGALYI